MKLKQYLNEGKTTKIDLREWEFDSMEFLETLLTKNCQPYLKTIKGTKELLFRGTNQSFKLAQITPRKNRTPKDTPLKYHKLLDKLFNIKFGWKPRSTGIFCSGRDQARVYGNVYSIWPIGQFKFIWSPVIHDLYMKIYNLAWGTERWSIDLEQSTIQELVDTYQKTNLKLAIDNRNEIMLNCSEYYLLSLERSLELHTFLKGRVI